MILKTKSLHHKLVLTVSSVMLLLSLATAVISYTYEFKHSQLETEIILNQLLDTVSRTASIAAYSKNEQIGKDVLHGLLNNSVVQSAYISSNKGFSLGQENNQLSLGTSVYRELISPFNKGETIGTISLHASVEYDLAKAKRGAIFSIIISVSLITLTTLIILWQVKRHISTPLSYLSNTLHKIKTEKVKRIPSLVHHEKDELGRLCLDINTLLDTLELQFNAEHSLREQVEEIEKQLRHIYNSSSAGLFSLDEHGSLLSYNSTLTSILNNSDQINQTLTTLVLFESLFNKQNDFALLITQALKSGNLESQDFSLANSSSASHWVHCLLSKIIDPSGKVIIEGVIFDVTERVQKEELIKHEAHHDSLTGMLRRKPAQAQFESHISSTPSANACFLLMDLDGFKKINDTYGHLAGDQVLSVTAERLFQCVRSSDVVCRLGGDEFLIILLNNRDANVKFHVADKILNSIRQPISLLTGSIVSVGISIGITDLNLSNTSDFDTLIKDADKAMYEVKQSGKNDYLAKY